MKDGKYSVSLASSDFTRNIVQTSAMKYSFMNHVSVLDSVLSSPKILHVPLLLLANKQDSPDSLSVQEIRESYEQWYQGKKDSARRRAHDEGSGSSLEQHQERFASLDVMGVSALEGYVDH